MFSESGQEQNIPSKLQEGPVHDIPSRLQEGPGKNKKIRIRQSTTLAFSRQKKSLGLVKSAKHHKNVKHEGKHISDLRQKKKPKRIQNAKKDPRD